MRCRFATTVAALALIALTGGCAEDDATVSPPEPVAATTTAAPSPSAAPAFPVTVEHAFGSTELQAEPQRVVSVGIAEQDMILALGVTPIGVSEWYGEQPFATWPWAQDELGDAEPEVLLRDDGLQYERIAALDPDLIIGTNAGLEQDQYDRLSQIAPTIAHGEGAESYAEDWTAQTIRIGRALGKEEQAQEIVADIKADFADAAAEHPEFAGTPIFLLQNAFYDGEAIALIEGAGTSFLTDLGFEIPTSINSYVRSDDPTQAYIPLENLSVLDDADLLLWATEKAEDVDALESEALYNRLDAIADGKAVFTDGVLAGAIYFRSPLSFGYVLDELVPMLADALAGKGPQSSFGDSESASAEPTS